MRPFGERRAWGGHEHTRLARAFGVARSEHGHGGKAPRWGELRGELWEARTRRRAGAGPGGR